MEEGLIPKEVNLPAERMQTAKGLGNIEQEDRIIPRLKIMQSNSPEVDEGIAKAGELVNSVSKKSYGKVINFVPVMWWKSRIDWAPRDQGGEIICQARDAVTGSNFGPCAECDYSKWVQKEPPICTAIINILGLIGAEVVAISFMKTSYTTGKQLINLFNYKRFDIFNFQYELGTKQEENALGKFQVLYFKNMNTPVDDTTYKICSAIYENFAQMKEKVQPVDTTPGD